MKVLMITPRVDESHDLLGFIPGWIRELAGKVDKLYVITSYHNRKTLLPENAIIYDISHLGEKWDSASKAMRLIRLLGRQIYFNITMFRIVPKIDVVFCHMYPNFSIFVAPYAKLSRKPIVTWYAHGHVSRRLRIAHFLANKMVTPSKESLRIKSDKIIVTSHGIDTDRFKSGVQDGMGKRIILSVGRISPIKDHETLIKAADILVNEKDMNDLEFVIVGGVPMASHGEYYKKLKGMVKELKLEDYVKFVGAVPFREVVKYYEECDIHVNLCPTGGADKAVLEAMACEKPVIVCNETFKEMLMPFDGLCLFKHRDYKDMAEKLKHILDNEHLWSEIGMHNREEVVKSHNVSRLADSLVDIFNEVTKCM